MRRRWPILLLGGAILVSTLLLLYLGRNQTVLVDQWAYVFAYRSWSPSTLLFPHNGHLVVFAVLVYKAMFEVFGIGSQLPYQLVNLALSATVVLLLFALIRDRVGELLALAAATLILFYGPGLDTILVTYAFPNLIGIATGLAGLLVLRRGDLKGDLAACLLLTLSVASYSAGVAFVAGAAVAVALRPAGRRLRSVWVFALPLAGYIAWMLWARQFGQEPIYVHNLKTLGSAVADQLAAVLSGLTGLFTTPNGPPPASNPIPIRTTWGPVLVAGLGALVFLRMRRMPRPGPDAIVAIVVLFAYLLMIGIALNQFRNTFDTRFVYFSSVLLLLAVAELLAPYRPSPTALVGVAIVFLFSMCASVAELGDGAKALHTASAVNKAKLAAVNLAGTAASPTALVERPPEDMAFSVATWHELEDEFGSPAYSEAELRKAPLVARQAADEELVRVMRIAPTPVRSVAPAPSAPPPAVALKGGEAEPRRRGRCVSLLPRGASNVSALVRLKSGGISYESAAPVEVSIGRFADLPIVSLPARAGASRLAMPDGASPAPWTVAMRVSAPTLVCPAVA
jgi:hypothetical protein